MIQNLSNSQTCGQRRENPLRSAAAEISVDYHRKTSDE
jgi:hypothetical protein